jgi:hypothetical protein
MKKGMDEKLTIQIMNEKSLRWMKNSRFFFFWKIENNVLIQT